MSGSTWTGIHTAGGSMLKGLLKSGKAPDAPPKTEIPSVDTAEVEQAREDERKRLRGLSGRSSTKVAGLLTGDAPVQKKTLLGQ